MASNMGTSLLALMSLVSAPVAAASLRSVASLGVTPGLVLLQQGAHEVITPPGTRNKQLHLSSELHSVGLDNWVKRAERATIPQAPVPEEFQCASEWSTPKVGCETCTMNVTCACDGYVKFGYGSDWSEWLDTAPYNGTVICNRSTFPDPDIGQGKVCMCKSKTYIVATEYPVPTAECLECTLPSRGECFGQVRYGYGMQWTPWFKASGPVECTTSYFGMDPFVGHGKVCECMPDSLHSSLTSDQNIQAAVPVETLMWAIIGVSFTYFAVYAVLQLARSWSMATVSMKDPLMDNGYEVNGQPGPIERAFESAISSCVYFAPMLCPVFFAVSKRSSTLTGGNPEAYGYPPGHLEVAAGVCAVAFIAQTVCHILAELASRPQAFGAPASSLQPHERAVDAMKMWRNLGHVFLSIEYVALAVLLIGVALMTEPEAVSMTIGKVPMAAGTICTIILSGAYFAVYLVLHVLKSQDPSVFLQGPGYSHTTFGIEVMKLAATAMNFAPMLCVLVLGMQIAVDWENLLLPKNVQACMYLCTFSVLIQVILVIAAPFIAKAELQVTGPRGEVDFVTRNHAVFIFISVIRWGAMTALYLGIGVVCAALWQLQAVPPMTTLLCRLAAVYFLAYLLLWGAITAKHLCGGFDRIIRILTVAKDAVVFCPMVAVLFLGCWVRAHRFINKYGAVGVPQSYAQDFMQVSLVALVVQLLLVLMSGAAQHDHMTSHSSLDRGVSAPLLFLFHCTMLVLYVSVAVVIYSLFTVSPDNATSQGAWFVPN